MRIFKILSKFNLTSIILLALAAGGSGLLFGSSPAHADTNCPASTICGTVTDLAGTGIPDILVQAFASVEDYDNNTEPIVTTSARTDASGVYAIPDLPTGSYLLVFKAQYGLDYVGQLYSTQMSSGLVMLWMTDDATLVPVAGESGTQANTVKMSLAGFASGQVTDPANLASPAVANIPVTLYYATASNSINDTGSPVWNTTADESGYYLTTGVPAGSYWVEYNSYNSDSYNPNYPTLFYGQVQNNSTAEATPVTVNESQDTTVNMSLIRLIPSVTTVTSSSPTAVVGQEVTYTVTVTPGSTSSGRVTMLDGGQLLPGCAFNMIDNGIVICHVTYVTAGTHSITAEYHSGDVYRASTSAPLIETITGSFSDLKNANLVGANLAGADLTGVNLSGVDLTGANLSSANLTGANLKNATLTGVDFTDANLNSTQLKGAALVDADFTGADLSYANLMGVNLSGANLSYANLTNATLKNANLTNATLTGADLTGANLKGANLTGVIY